MVLSEAVREGEACDSNLRQTGRVGNILLEGVSHVLGLARKMFGAWPDGLLEHFRYIVMHEDNQGRVVHCRQGDAVGEAGVARSAIDVPEVGLERGKTVVRLGMLRAA